MVGDTAILALIPARGGSKSIPRKNLRLFGGHPLVAWSIAAGLQAESVDRVVVSTDDPEIAGVSRSYGAETPFTRPADLGRDDTPDLPVFQHALEWLAKEEGYRPDIVVQLRPTSPIRPIDCVDGAIATLAADDRADSVRGVVPSGQNPYKMWTLEGGTLLPLLEEPAEAYNMPRQSLPQTYWQTGHIDAIRSGTITKKNSMSGQRILPWLIDPRYTVDIDTDRDWHRAERILNDPELEYVRPGPAKRPLPQTVDLLIMDFDGVLTDNRVWVGEAGGEMVAAHRGDGWGLARLREAGTELLVLSTETNPVVRQRCEKLGVESLQGIEDKGQVLRSLLADRKLESQRVVYVGNDVNDLACFPLVGCAVAVADADPQVLREADITLNTPGGLGAVRELCDRILSDRL